MGDRIVLLVTLLNVHILSSGSTQERAIILLAAVPVVPLVILVRQWLGIELLSGA